MMINIGSTRGGGGVLALILIIKNFLDSHGIATKSGECLFLNLLENDILEKNVSRVLLVAMATPFSMPCFMTF